MMPKGRDSSAKTECMVTRGGPAEEGGLDEVGGPEGLDDTSDEETAAGAVLTDRRADCLNGVRTSS